LRQQDAQRGRQQHEAGMKNDIVHSHGGHESTFG
jgi:hypothetical protein